MGPCFYEAYNGGIIGSERFRIRGPYWGTMRSTLKYRDLQFLAAFPIERPLVRDYVGLLGAWEVLMAVRLYFPSCLLRLLGALVQLNPDETLSGSPGRNTL